jgi:hypothetical protein
VNNVKKKLEGDIVTVLDSVACCCSMLRLMIQMCWS